MSKRYNVNGPNASGSTNKTCTNIIGSTAIRPAIYDAVVGPTSTPADQTVEMALGRTTAVGTAGSGPTPNPLDPADVAAVCTAGITHSAEPTYASTYLLYMAMNQRITFRWVAAPGGELYGSATASNGLGLKLVTATASAVEHATVHWVE